MDRQETICYSETVSQKVVLVRVEEYDSAVYGLEIAKGADGR